METSDQILNKAHSLFFEYGIRSITMSHLASRLGMSKKTIYKYFANKDILIKTLIANTINEHIDDYEKLRNQRADAIIELFAIMIHAAKLRLKFTEAIMLDIERDHQEAYELLKNYKNVFIYQGIHNTLLFGIRQSLLADNFNVAVMSRFFLESIITISVMVKQTDNILNTRDLMEEILAHLITGIATFDGIELVGRYRNEHELFLLHKPGSHIFLNA